MAQQVVRSRAITHQLPQVLPQTKKMASAQAPRAPHIWSAPRGPQPQPPKHLDELDKDGTRQVTSYQFTRITRRALQDELAEAYHCVAEAKMKRQLAEEKWRQAGNDCQHCSILQQQLDAANKQIAELQETLRTRATLHLANKENATRVQSPPTAPAMETTNAPFANAIIVTQKAVATCTPQATAIPSTPIASPKANPTAVNSAQPVAHPETMTIAPPTSTANTAPIVQATTTTSLPPTPPQRAAPPRGATIASILDEVVPWHCTSPRFPSSILDQDAPSFNGSLMTWPDSTPVLESSEEPTSPKWPIMPPQKRPAPSISPETNAGNEAEDTRPGKRRIPREYFSAGKRRWKCTKVIKKGPNGDVLCERRAVTFATGLCPTHLKGHRS